MCVPLDFTRNELTQRSSIPEIDGGEGHRGLGKTLKPSIEIRQVVLLIDKQMWGNRDW